MPEEIDAWDKLHPGLADKITQFSGPATEADPGIIGDDLYHTVPIELNPVAVDDQLGHRSWSDSTSVQLSSRIPRRVLTLLIAQLRDQVLKEYARAKPKDGATVVLSVMLDEVSR